MKRNARVLVVTNMWPGEASAHSGVFVQRQVEALRRERPDWTFDVFMIRGWKNRIDYLAAVWRLRRRLRRGYDLVHAHYGLSALTAALAGARPLVVTLHGGEIEVPWQKPLTRLALRRSAAVIAVSEWVRQEFDHERLHVVSCGVPLDVFRPLERADARARLGLPERVPVVLFPADPSEPIKDHALFREAVARVRRELPDVVELTLGVPADEVPVRMAAADLVVLTSKQESGPLVVKEALACGRPVVAVDVGDVRATIEGLPGCAVTPHRADEIAAAALRVLRSAEADTAAAAALRRQRIVELRLDEASVAREVLRIHDSLIAA